MSYLDSLMSTGETVQFSSRQHWVTLLRALAINGLLLIAGLLFAGWLFRGGETGPLRGAGPLLGWFVLALLLWPFARLAVAIARWWAKHYVVTSRRVIEVDGLVNRVVTDSNLDKVNDVVLRQGGLGRLLNYGQIDIITGSDIGLNRLEFIRDPIGFKRVMLDNKEDFDTLARRQIEAASAIDPAEVPAAIESLAALRDRGHITPQEFEQRKAALLARLG